MWLSHDLFAQFSIEPGLSEAVRHGGGRRTKNLQKENKERGGEKEKKRRKKKKKEAEKTGENMETKDGLRCIYIEVFDHV